MVSEGPPHELPKYWWIIVRKNLAKPNSCQPQAALQRRSQNIRLVELGLDCFGSDRRHDSISPEKRQPMIDLNMSSIYRIELYFYLSHNSASIILSSNFAPRPTPICRLSNMP